MPSYPSIPFFDMRAGFRQTGPQNATIRTEMSSGPVKMRRRFTAAPRVIQASTGQLTQTELATFEMFYETTLQMGALSFTHTYPPTGATETFRFTGGYEVVPFGQGYAVSAELEILP